MDNRASPTHDNGSSLQNDLPPVPLRVTEVEAQAIDEEKPLIPEDRRISWLGWIVAILVFMVNRKIGLALFAALIVFGKFPSLNMKQLPKKAGSLLRKLRS